MERWFRGTFLESLSSVTCFIHVSADTVVQISPLFSVSSLSGLAKFFHNGVSLRKDAVLASIRRVQHILCWFESQHQLTFYASSLLFVYEGLPSSSSSSSLSSPLSTPSISPTAGKTTTLSSAGDSGQGGEGIERQAGVGQEEEVAEYNNNNIQVLLPWDYSMSTIYTNHTKGGQHLCTKGHLHGDSGASDSAVEMTVSAVSALCEEDNSVWKRTGEPHQAPNGNGNKSVGWRPSAQWLFKVNEKLLKTNFLQLGLVGVWTRVCHAENPPARVGQVWPKLIPERFPPEWFPS